jgi:hypothetical protein
MSTTSAVTAAVNTATTIVEGNITCFLIALLRQIADVPRQAGHVSGRRVPQVLALPPAAGSARRACKAGAEDV